MSLTDAMGPLGAIRERKESDFFSKTKSKKGLHETSSFLN